MSTFGAAPLRCHSKILQMCLLVSKMPPTPTTYSTDTTIQKPGASVIIITIISVILLLLGFLLGWSLWFVNSNLCLCLSLSVYIYYLAHNKFQRCASQPASESVRCWSHAFKAPLKILNFRVAHLKRLWKRRVLEVHLWSTSQICFRSATLPPKCLQVWLHISGWKGVTAENDHSSLFIL